MCCQNQRTNWSKNKNKVGCCGVQKYAWVDFLAQRDSSSLFFVLSTCVQYVFVIMARHFKTLAVYRRALKIAREWPSIVTDPASPVIRDPEQALEDADYIRKEAR